MQTALDAYYTALKDYDRVGAAHETAVRSAMQNLLAEVGKEKGWKRAACRHPVGSGGRATGSGCPERGVVTRSGAQYFGSAP